jgi:glycosyltransferase involved in cell wall biosynthesis
MVKHLITVMHSHCDAVIAHSRKSAEQMRGWQNGDEHYQIHILPTGVDPIPPASSTACADFRKEWGVQDGESLVTYVGRLSPEKNLDMLIEMIVELVKWRPNTKLMYVGDFAEYRPKLEEKAAASPAAGHIIFTGRLPREDLGKVFGATNVFVFPSLTDTQSLALHEAAQAGLPIVMIDEPVTEVVHDGVNGYFSKNDPIDMAAKVNHVLDDPANYKKMSKASREIAGQFSEKIQSEKILDIYEHIIRSKTAAAETTNN